VGIEVPNSAKVTVGLGTILESPDFANSGKPLLVALGRDIAGGSLFGNIAKMPHVLIAGATGSGKSVTIHTIINSLLYRAGPPQLRFIMIDPKRVELTLYNQLPHLLSPVITDPKKAILALRWAGKEMERRYNILEENRVRDIDSYHQNILTPALEKIRKEGAPGEGESVPEAMPYIVIVIDELADIMQSFPRELEAAIVRLAQMSRAVGIHLILSTQRPSVNVITGLIKANIPARIALQVSSQIDSRTILDQGGAEKLLGAGDMLYLSGDMGKPVRLQSAFISETEVKKVTSFIAKNNEPEVPIDIAGPAPSSSGMSFSGSTGGNGLGEEDDVDDEVYESARQAVIEAGKASTSYIQRKLRIGYSRAARIMDMLEERGVIGAQDGAKPREVLGKSGTSSEQEETL
jgi:S-DNA-T family DNA segregation ATPase FtsK/SpoIIIE